MIGDSLSDENVQEKATYISNVYRKFYLQIKNIFKKKI